MHFICVIGVVPGLFSHESIKYLVAHHQSEPQFN